MVFSEAQTPFLFLPDSYPTLGTVPSIRVERLVSAGGAHLVPAKFRNDNHGTDHSQEKSNDDYNCLGRRFSQMACDWSNSLWVKVDENC